jgi:Bacterial Ig domain
MKWNGASWDAQTLDSGKSSYGNVSLALDNGGNPAILFNASLTFNSRGLYLTRWDGSTWTTETVDTSYFATGTPTLALDANNTPHIAFQDGLNQDLRTAQKIGSSWIHTVIDNIGNTGNYSSIAVDSNGDPHIAFSDQETARLRLASWKNSSWQIREIEPFGTLGHISMSIDSNNFPHIAYMQRYDLNLAIDNLTYAKSVLPLRDPPPVNHPPMTNSDIVNSVVNKPIRLNLLINDTDPDNDTLTLASFLTTPIHGTVEKTVGYPEGVVTYTPEENYVGEDYFSYIVSDGKGGTAQEFVGFIVGGNLEEYNSPPQVGVDNYPSPLCSGDSIDFDLYGLDFLPPTPLTYIIHHSNPATQATLTAPNHVHYNSKNFVGQDRGLSYEIFDGQAYSDLLTFNITVKQRTSEVVAVNDSVAIEGGQRVYLKLLQNDSTRAGDTLVMKNVTQPINGKVGVISSTGDGYIYYKPNLGFTGIDTFRYTASSRNRCDQKNATVTVYVGVPAPSGVNHAPSSLDATHVVEKNVRSEIILPATDADGDQIVYSSQSGPDQGTIEITQNPQIIYYTPALDYIGSDHIELFAFDGKAGVLPNSVELDVQEISDPPPPEPSPFPTPEDSPSPEPSPTPDESPSPVAEPTPTETPVVDTNPTEPPNPQPVPSPTPWTTISEVNLPAEREKKIWRGKNLVHTASGDKAEFTSDNPTLQATHVTIRDRRGKIVSEFNCEGHQFSWNGLDRDGSPAPAGFYIAYIEQNGALVQKEKIVLLK